MSGEPTFEIMVLSAPAAADRRARVRTMMADMEVRNWSFFDVVPAEDLPVAYSDEASFRAYGSVLSPPEVSCATSHLAMMQRLLDSDLSHVVVLEDDVFVDPQCDFDRLVRFAAATDINYLKLYARYFVPTRHLTTIGRYSLYRTSWPALGTQAYVLSRAGARHLLDHVSVTGLVHPIDVSMDRFWENGLPTLVFYPFPLIELMVPTTIHNQANRIEVEEKNRVLASRSDLGKKRPAIVDTLRRVIADRRLMASDARLRQRLNQDRRALHSLLYPEWHDAVPRLASVSDAKASANEAAA
jgi:glycosyl transferase family 25